MSQTHVSKWLTWALRHGAQELGIFMHRHGWVAVEDLLDHRHDQTSYRDVKEIVRSCPKQRFELQDWHGRLWIRASQGHSIAQVADDMNWERSRADDWDPHDEVVHGTYLHCFLQIRTQGLKRMGRNHVHLCKGLPGSGVISGMRNSADVVIYVSPHHAIAKHGQRFQESSNGVILTSELAPCCFTRIEWWDPDKYDWVRIWLPDQVHLAEDVRQQNSAFYWAIKKAENKLRDQSWSRNRSTKQPLRKKKKLTSAEALQRVRRTLRAKLPPRAPTPAPQAETEKRCPIHYRTGFLRGHARPKRLPAPKKRPAVLLKQLPQTDETELVESNRKRKAQSPPDETELVELNKKRKAQGLPATPKIPSAKKMPAAKKMPVAKARPDSSQPPPEPKEPPKGKLAPPQPKCAALPPPPPPPPPVPRQGPDSPDHRAREPAAEQEHWELEESWDETERENEGDVPSELAMTEEAKKQLAARKEFNEDRDKELDDFMWNYYLDEAAKKNLRSTPPAVQQAVFRCMKDGNAPKRNNSAWTMSLIKKCEQDLSHRRSEMEQKAEEYLSWFYQMEQLDLEDAQRWRRSWNNAHQHLARVRAAEPKGLLIKPPQEVPLPPQHFKALEYEGVSQDQALDLLPVGRFQLEVAKASAAAPVHHGVAEVPPGEQVHPGVRPRQDAELQAMRALIDVDQATLSAQHDVAQVTPARREVPQDYSVLRQLVGQASTESESSYHSPSRASQSSAEAEVVSNKIAPWKAQSSPPPPAPRHSPEVPRSPQHSPEVPPHPQQVMSQHLMPQQMDPYQVAQWHEMMWRQWYYHQHGYSLQQAPAQMMPEQQFQAAAHMMPEQQFQAQLHSAASQHPQLRMAVEAQARDSQSEVHQRMSHQVMGEGCGSFRLSEAEIAARCQEAENRQKAERRNEERKARREEREKKQREQEEAERQQALQDAQLQRNFQAQEDKRLRRQKEEEAREKERLRREKEEEEAREKERLRREREEEEEAREKERLRREREEEEEAREEALREKERLRRQKEEEEAREKTLREKERLRRQKEEEEAEKKRQEEEAKKKRKLEKAQKKREAEEKARAMAEQREAEEAKKKEAERQRKRKEADDAAAATAYMEQTIRKAEEDMALKRKEEEARRKSEAEQKKAQDKKEAEQAGLRKAFPQMGEAQGRKKNDQKKLQGEKAAQPDPEVEVRQDDQANVNPEAWKHTEDVVKNAFPIGLLQTKLKELQDGIPQAKPPTEEASRKTEAVASGKAAPANARDHVTKVSDSSSSSSSSSNTPRRKAAEALKQKLRQKETKGKATRARTAEARSSRDRRRSRSAVRRRDRRSSSDRSSSDRRQRRHRRSPPARVRTPPAPRKRRRSPSVRKNTKKRARS